MNWKHLEDETKDLLQFWLGWCVLLIIGIAFIRVWDRTEKQANNEAFKVETPAPMSQSLKVKP